MHLLKFFVVIQTQHVTHIRARSTKFFFRTLSHVAECKSKVPEIKYKKLFLFLFPGCHQTFIVPGGRRTAYHALNISSTCNVKAFLWVHMIFSPAHVCCEEATSKKWFEIPQSCSSPAMAKFDMQQRSRLQAQARKCEQKASAVSGKNTKRGRKKRRENVHWINRSAVDSRNRPLTACGGAPTVSEAEKAAGGHGQ